MNRKNTVPFCAISVLDSKTVEMSLNGYIVPPSWADGELYHSAQTFIDEFKQLDGKYEVINIQIGALYGGSVYEGNVIFNTIENAKSIVNTHVTGLAASMGYQLFLAGAKRTMNETAQLMAHKAWTFVIGNADDMRREAVIMDKIDNSIKLVTKTRSNLSDEDIDKMFSTDTFISAQEAKSYAMATDVIPLKNTSEESKIDPQDMKNFIQGAFMGGLFNLNKSNAMTQEEIDKIKADAKAEAKAELEAANKAALDAKDSEIAALKAETEKKEAPVQEAKEDPSAALASKIEQLSAKLEALEKTTAPEAAAKKEDKITDGETEEKSYTAKWVDKF